MFGPWRRGLIYEGRPTRPIKPACRGAGFFLRRADTENASRSSRVPECRSFHAMAHRFEAAGRRPRAWHASVLSMVHAGFTLRCGFSRGLFF